MSAITAEAPFRRFIEAVAAGDEASVRRILGEAPELVIARATTGATRAESTAFFLPQVGHYMYAGGTALHVAAAGYFVEIVRVLLDAGANVRARDRRGAEPLHHAADGGPGSDRWNPSAQAATITALARSGADVNAHDANGATPLHRAARTRCSAAIRALLDAGADPTLVNRSGSTALDLAVRTTGRGGTGSPAAKAEQAKIIALLREA